MYIRPVHAVLEPPTLQAFIRANPLGLLTTHIPHPTIPALQITHVPFVLDAPSAEHPQGRLRGHIARANPQVKAIISALGATNGTLHKEGAEEEVLVLFQSPTHSYISPKYYTTTKPETGKVVPTWDYAAVQVYGTLRAYHTGPEAAEWLQAQVEALTTQQEGEGEGSWEVADAPKNYVDLLKKAIIGIEVQIKRIEGRFKLSQELADGDWRGVVKAFKEKGDPEAIVMAKMIEEAAKDKREIQ